LKPICELEDFVKPRDCAVSWLRGWNITIRTGHITAIAALFGGHLFGAATERLIPWLYASVLTGLMLAIIEAIPRRNWFREGSGLLSMAKVLVLCLVPLFWNYRIPLLAAVIVVGSVGSHVPHGLRHYRVFGGE
jgi:hypothetical protein